MNLFHTAYGPPDAPRLLLVHGGPGASHDYMLPQMLALACDYRLIVYDQRGGGQSTTDDRSPITWRTHVEDLAALANKLELEPLTVVGYSWGGLLALLYSITLAGGFRDEGFALPASALVPVRLVLICPAPPTHVLRKEFSDELARRQRAPWMHEERQRLTASGLRERDPAAYAKRLFELSVAGYFADPGRARELTPFRLVGRVQQSVWESLGAYDLTSRLPLVTANTIVLHGAHDAIPVESSELIASRVAHGELAVLAESGHVPYVEGSDDFFAAVREFLQRSTGARP